MPRYDLPMYEEEFTRIAEHNTLDLLDHINFLRGLVTGGEYKIKELEEQVQIARQYQRKLDVNWLHQRGLVSTARRITGEPLDTEYDPVYDEEN